MSAAPELDIRSYRGSSLEEVLPQIVDEMGIDAVIVRQREGIVGGIGGFFGKRCVEVDVRPGTPASPRSPSEAVRAYERRLLVDAYDTGDLLEEASRSRFFEEVVRQTRPFSAHLDEAEGRIEFAADEPVAIEEAKAEAFSEPEDEARREEAEPPPEPELELEPEPEPEPSAELEAAPDPEQAPTLDAQQAPAPDAEPAEPAPTPRPEPAPTLDAQQAPAPHAEQAPAPDAVPLPEPPTPAAPVTARAEAQAWAAAEIASIKARLDSGRPRRGARLSTELVSPEALELRALLLEAGIGERLAASILEEVVRRFLPFARLTPLRDHVRSTLARRIEVRQGWRSRRRRLALVGPRGAGKTLTAAKLAHAYARAGVSVALLGLEPRRAPTLIGLTAALGLDLRLADAPAEAEAAAARLGDAELVIVDTPAVEAGDAAGMELLASLLSAVAPDETHLVLAASTGASAAAEAVSALRHAARVDRLLLTRLDGRTQGGSVGAALAAGCPFSYVGRGARADAGIAPADPAELARLVIA